MIFLEKLTFVTKLYCKGSNANFTLGWNLKFLFFFDIKQSDKSIVNDNSFETKILVSWLNSIDPSSAHVIAKSFIIMNLMF